MNILDIAKRIRKFLIKGKKPFFEMDINVQKKIIGSFPEPLSQIDRSYFQYLCQMQQVPMILRVFQNVAAFFLLPYYLIAYYIKEENIVNSQKNVAVFISGTDDLSYIPNSLVKEFKEIYSCGYTSKIHISKDDLKIMRKIFLRYWYKPYFLLKILIKIGLYSNQLIKYNPKAIITFSEFSFTSSVLTYYCNQKEVKHINIMHGEKLFNIRDSFVEFDRFYVWDEHYVNLFIKLKAANQQFIVEKPKYLQLNISSRTEYEFKLTYYLGGEDEQSLNDLAQTLSNLSIPKEKICIRYHPRYSNWTQIQNIFYGFTIQDPNYKSIKDSLEMTYYVASLYSTVLYEALYNGKKIIVDDITNSSKYEKLKLLDYIVLKKEHKLLSDLLNY